jgi:hypothetical protein
LYVARGLRVLENERDNVRRWDCGRWGLRRSVGASCGVMVALIVPACFMGLIRRPVGSWTRRERNWNGIVGLTRCIMTGVLGTGNALGVGWFAASGGLEAEVLPWKALGGWELFA